MVALFTHVIVQLYFDSDKLDTYYNSYLKHKNKNELTGINEKLENITKISRNQENDMCQFRRDPSVLIS